MATYTKVVDEPLVPNLNGWTTAEAEAQRAIWGKNEIPEEKEPLWRMFLMQFVGTMPMTVRSAAPHPPLPCASGIADRC